MKENLPNSCKPIGMVYETTDYDLFSFIEYNRKTDHVQALVESFREKDVPNAILCNEKLQIIDGQNRFLARKKLGLPILFYCIDGLDIYDVAFLNSYGKNWGMKDFVDMWASLGKEEYVKIKKFCELYPDFPLKSSIFLLRGMLSTTIGGHNSDQYLEGEKKSSSNKAYLKHGEFKVVDWDKAVYMANCIMEYKPFCSPGTSIYKHEAFISAMIVLIRNNAFDNAEMVRRAGLYRDLFYKCQSKENYIKMLNNLWNYKRKNGKKSFNY